MRQQSWLWKYRLLKESTNKKKQRIWPQLPICIGKKILMKRIKNTPLFGPNPVPLRQSNALVRAAAWTARDSVKPQIPIVDMAIFNRVFRLFADAIPILLPIDAPVTLENPVESDGAGPVVVDKSPPSTVKNICLSQRRDWGKIGW